MLLQLKYQQILGRFVRVVRIYTLHLDYGPMVLIYSGYDGAEKILPHTYCCAGI
jgi:hypothetical protein